MKTYSVLKPTNMLVANLFSVMLGFMTVMMSYSDNKTKSPKHPEIKQETRPQYKLLTEYLSYFMLHLQPVDQGMPCVTSVDSDQSKTHLCMTRIYSHLLRFSSLFLIKI